MRGRRQNLRKSRCCTGSILRKSARRYSPSWISHDRCARRNRLLVEIYSGDLPPCDHARDDPDVVALLREEERRSGEDPGRSFTNPKVFVIVFAERERGSEAQPGLRKPVCKQTPISSFVSKLHSQLLKYS
ncbi:hypothetical protein Nepgr_023545 [Nepenthes gracilis]|uniref:Uncharacterized protein n=1 Tax=Nepenthes gracilis TaxID=150966 RepID=A0AAD3XXY9_NEPGR|nr:hypothetical protein Nepgr_023545 [Nepenthes gracilis]